VRTVFIGDSNPLALKHEHFLRVLEALYTTFPELERVTSYARAKTIKRKSMGELRELREAGLTRLHIGLETGDDKLLKYINKGASAEDMCIAGSKVMDAGMELTEYVILGLGGRERWAEHAVATARVLNIINPHWIRVRTLILRPNAPLYKWAQRGEFVPSTAEEVLQETRMLIDNLNVTSEFLSDHVSNYLPVNGRLPEDQGKMLEFIDMTLETLRLVPDAKTRILQPEWLRRL
jgi:coproporphyrinogen III oxidase-like Fe-S oxidoreductase